MLVAPASRLFSTSSFTTEHKSTMTWPDWIWWTCRLSVRFSKNWNSLDLPSGLLWVLLWPWHGCLRQRGRVNFLEVEVLFDARTSLPPPPTRFYISAARSTNEKQIFLDECHAPDFMDSYCSSFQGPLIFSSAIVLWRRGFWGKGIGPILLMWLSTHAF